VGIGYDECIAGFEAAKHFTATNVEFWMARDLMKLLSYAAWDKFEGVIEKARKAAKSSGAPVDNHFSQTANMVPIGSGAQRERADWYLSRYAAYLIAMNADSSKAEVGYAMTYFAVKTRRQEIQERQLLGDEEKRVQIRLRTIGNNRRLAGAAKKAGVIRYALFQDAGHRGFYGGLGVSEVKRRKGIPDAEELLDRIGPLELSAHDFRITLTEDRLNRENVNTEADAIATHRMVGSDVRAVMQKEDGKKPEDLPIAPSIKKIVQKHRKQIGDGKV
jgi:DNA-damage-inducible protein D